MTPQVFVSTACLPGVQRLRDRVDDLRQHGLTAIEFGAGVEIEPGVDTLPIETGDHVLIHNYFPPPAVPFVLNLASADETIRARSVALVTDAIDLSARIGAPFYSVHAGFITDPSAFDGRAFVFPAPASANEVERAMERFVTTLRGLVEHAAARGVTILVENNVCVPAAVGKLLLQSADAFTELFAALPNPNLGVLLDTGHLNVSARTLGFDRLDFVDEVTPHVRAFHVHDNDGTADTHDAVRPGSWVLDVLRRPPLRDLAVIVEAKFADAFGLARHVDGLSTALAH